MISKIEALMAEVENLTANSAEELEALRIKYLSKKGAINDLMADFRNVPAEQKKEVGMQLNALKTRATERIAELKEAFETNDFELFTELCAHPFIMIGDVVHGKKLGRTVGMPTTNLHIYKTKKRPNSGVYATKLVIENQKYLAATNIGTRPTVDDFDYITIESFILDFNKQIYGEVCVLEVHKYLRGIQKFDGLEQVQAQVKRDVEEIKQFFA